MRSRYGKTCVIPKYILTINLLVTAKGRASLRAAGRKTAKKNCRVKAGKHRGWFKKCRKGETARDYKKKTRKVSKGKSAKRVAAGKKLAASLPRVNGKFAKRGAEWGKYFNSLPTYVKEEGGGSVLEAVKKEEPSGGGSKSSYFDSLPS